MSKKKSDQKDVKAALPEWRLKVLAVPESERCPTQRTLLRALDLAESLVDQLNDKPPLKPGTPEANKAFLTCLEVFYHRFKHNYANALLPAAEQSWTAVVMSLRETLKADYLLFMPPDQLYIAQQIGRPGAEPLRYTALILWLIMSKMDPVSTELERVHLEHFLEQLGDITSVLQGLQENNGDALLAEKGSWLTISNMMSMATVARAVFQLELDRGNGPSPGSMKAVSQYFDILMKSEQPCWYTFCSYCFILTRTLEVPGFPSVESLLAKAMQRYLAFAETENDPFRIAWCAYDVGDWQPEGYYTDFEELLRKAEEGERACKAWMPLFYRKSAFVYKQALHEKLDDARLRWPSTYRTQFLREGNGEYKVRHTMVHSPIEDAIKVCASCGVKSRGLNCCAAVQKGVLLQ